MDNKQREIHSAHTNHSKVEHTHNSQGLILFYLTISKCATPKGKEKSHCATGNIKTLKMFKATVMVRFIRAGKMIGG